MGIEVVGLKELEAAVGAVADAWKYADTISSKVLPSVGEVDRKQNQQAFATEGSASGAPWAQLTALYAVRKRKLVGTKKILTFSGSMRDSLRFKRPARIERMADSVTMEFGTSHRLTQFHQEGTPRMVARPPVRKSERQADGLRAAVSAQFFKAAADAAGRRTKLGARLAEWADRFRHDARRSY